MKRVKIIEWNNVSLVVDVSHYIILLQPFRKIHHSTLHHSTLHQGSLASLAHLERAEEGKYAVHRKQIAAEVAVIRKVRNVRESVAGEKLFGDSVKLLESKHPEGERPAEDEQVHTLEHVHGGA